MELWIVFALLSAVFLSVFVLMLKRDVEHEPNTKIFALYPLPWLVLIPVMAYVFDDSIDYGIILSSEGFFLSSIGVLLLIKTATVAISLFCTGIALKSLPLTVVGPLRSISPLFVALLGFVLLGELLSFTNILGLCIIVVAVMLLDIDIRHPSQVMQFFTSFKNPAVFLLLVAAFIISFAAPIDKILLKQIDVFTNMFYFAVFVCITFWIVHIIQYKKLPIQDLSIHEFLWIQLTGIMAMLADLFILFSLTFPTALVAMVIGVRRLSNLFITIFGGAVLHEQKGTYKAVMCAVMIFGTLLLLA